MNDIVFRNNIIRVFERRYGEKPSILVRAPGRVNLMGEHTDYNDGFVLPMAIDRAILIALRVRSDTKVVVYSLDYDQEGTFSLDSLKKEDIDWLEYIKGVAWAMEDAGYNLRGWEGVLGGDIPIGAGLSSSAALELAAVRAFSATASLPWDAVNAARLGLKAETEWVGLNCGIMDQMISAAGKAGHALLIDCRNLEIEQVPLPPQCAVVVMDTATRRSLVTSAYNTRHEECASAAQYFGVPSLRDVSLDDFLDKEKGLDEEIRRRARHVITENKRTLEATQAMRCGDAVELGKLLNATHISLRDDFKVSSDELNIMTELAQKQAACYGARMTGGGFGGCAVAIVHTDAAGVFVKNVCQDYEQVTHLQPNLYVCAATNGAEIIY